MFTESRRCRVHVGRSPSLQSRHNDLLHFQNEAVDEALRLEELNDINGTGLWDWIKDKAEDAGDWIAEKLGDGKHEWKDYYRDAAFNIGIWIHGKLVKKQ